jgi:hypothetical protein
MSHIKHSIGCVTEVRVAATVAHIQSREHVQRLQRMCVKLKVTRLSFWPLAFTLPPLFLLSPSLLFFIGT